MPTTVLWTYVQFCWFRARGVAVDERGGGTTLENVGWYIAAGLGVVAIAAIVWTAIRSKAETPLPTPTSP
jgi:hypothetical protein